MQSGMSKELENKFGEVHETVSDIDERCFKERYNGESRKWLIRDASYKLPKDPYVSTMKSDFNLLHQEERRTTVGKRRALLQEKLLKEIAEEISQESKEAAPIEKYCTSYDVNFQIPGFKPQTKTYGDKPELYEKYPLYSSLPMSFWQYQYENRNGRPSDIHGLSSIADVKQPFKRNTSFSKPVSEVLDGDLL